MVDAMTNPRTPTGGDRVTIDYFDDNGQHLDTPTNATTAEITETCDGTVIARTYMEAENAPTPPGPPLGTATGEPAAWDLTKETWDIWVKDHDGKLVLAQTVADVLHTLWPDLSLPEQRERIASLMVLPIWNAAPETFRDDARRWLVATRPHR